MSIVHVAEAFVGGIVDFILNLTKALNHEKHYIIYAKRFESIESIKQKFAENVVFIEWPHASREISLQQDVKSALSLYWLLKKIDFQVLHLHSSKAGFIGRIIGARFKTKKIIYTPNGAPFLRTDISGFKIRVFKFLEKYASACSGEVIACSASERDAYLSIGVNASYINNGIEIQDLEYIEPDSTCFKIVTAGRATFQKNPRQFNELAKLFSHNPNVKFIWIGDGELRDELNSPNIEVTGWVSREAVRDKIAGSNVYISTALWEGLPFAVLEAMNLNMPLVLSNCVGNKDLVVEEYNGYLFNSLADAAAKINLLQAMDSQALKTIGINSFKLLQTQFSAESMSKQYLQKYIYPC